MSVHFLFVQFEFTSAVGPPPGRYVVEPVLLRAAEEAAQLARSPAREIARTGAGSGSESRALAERDASTRAEIEREAALRTRHAGSGTSLDPYLDMRNHQLAGTNRGVGASDVMVAVVASAPPVRLRVLRRARDVQPGTPDTVPLMFVSYVRASEPFSERRDADAALEEIKQSDELQRKWVRDGLIVLNEAIRGYRAGAPDPYAIEVMRRDARRVRIGYGTTDDVQHGLYQKAIELPPGKPGRSSRIERLKPAEAVGAVLSRRAIVLEGEDLVLRALIDLDNNRSRAATFQVAAALRLIPGELKVLPGGDHIDYRELQRALERSEVLVRVVTERPLNGTEVEELERLIDEVSGIIDGWRYQLLEGYAGR